MDFTESLRRVVKQMEQEVERSVEINRALGKALHTYCDRISQIFTKLYPDTSTGFLSKALEQHEKFGGAMKASRRYLLEHFRRDLKDRILFYTSFVIFIMSVIRVISRRIYTGTISLPDNIFASESSPPPSEQEADLSAA